MRHRPLWTVVALLLIAGTPATAGDLLDFNWSTDSRPAGFNGSVRSIMNFEGDMVVAGDFEAADTVAMKNVGRFDGSRWHGYGEGFNRPVLRLTSYRGDLVAAGMFTASGPDSIARIARWDGSRWQPFGEGFERNVMAAVEYEGELVAACLRGRGTQKMQAFSRWNGAEWTSMCQPSQLGSIELVGSPSDITVFRGHLIAAIGARVSGPTGKTVYPGLLWAGDRWVPFGPAWPETARAKRPYISRLHVDGDRLLAAGYFPTVRPCANRPARLMAWDGETWTALAPGLVGSIHAIARVGGDLVLAGIFDATTCGPGDREGGVLRGDGFSWSTLMPWEHGGAVWALGEFEGALFAGGTFTSIDGEPIWYLSEYTQGAWRPAVDQGGSALLEPVLALSAMGGEVLAEGDNHHDYDRSWMRNLFVKRDRRWVDFDPAQSAGVPAPPHTRPQFCNQIGVNWVLREALADVGGRLVYCQWGHRALSWSGTAWSRLPITVDVLMPGSSSRDNGAIKTIGAWGGRTVLAGFFDRINGVDARNIAIQDGDSWAPLGGGLQDSCDSSWVWWSCMSWPGLYCRVTSFAEYRGDLVAAGSFDQAGEGSANNIARWNGTSWLPFGDGLGDVVTDVAVVGDDLYASGYFSTSGSGAPLHYVARWDGAEWQGLAGGMDQPVLCLASYRGRLIAGGNFNTAGGVAARHLAAWDGTSWLPLGSGVNGAVNDLLVHDGVLYVGGEFSEAGGRAALHAAQWREPAELAALAGLAATREAAGVALRWTQAASALDLAGYRVYREPLGGARALLSDGLLTGGPGFSFLDAEPSPNRTDYWIAAVARDGGEHLFGPLTVDPEPGIPFALLGNRPNPFRSARAGGSTTIAFSTASEGPVRVRILDVAGRNVATLMDARLPSGEYEVAWDGRDDNGRGVPAGVYFCRLTAPPGELSRKLVILN